MSAVCGACCERVGVGVELVKCGRGVLGCACRLGWILGVLCGCGGAVSLELVAFASDKRACLQPKVVLAVCGAWCVRLGVGVGVSGGCVGCVWCLL